MARIWKSGCCHMRHTWSATVGTDTGGKRSQRRIGGAQGRQSHARFPDRAGCHRISPDGAPHGQRSIAQHILVQARIIRRKQNHGARLVPTAADSRHLHMDKHGGHGCANAEQKHPQQNAPAQNAGLPPVKRQPHVEVENLGPALFVQLHAAEWKKINPQARRQYSTSFPWQAPYPPTAVPEPEKRRNPAARQSPRVPLHPPRSPGKSGPILRKRREGPPSIRRFPM